MPATDYRYPFLEPVKERPGVRGRLRPGRAREGDDGVPSVPQRLRRLAPDRHVLLVPRPVLSCVDEGRPSNHMIAPSILGAATSAKSCVRRSTRSPGSGRTASTVKAGSISTFHTPRSRRTGTAKAASLPPEIATSPRAVEGEATLTIARYGLRTKGATPSRTPRAPRLRKSGQRRAEPLPADAAEAAPHRRLVVRPGCREQPLEASSRWTSSAPWPRASSRSRERARATGKSSTPGHEETLRAVPLLTAGYGVGMRRSSSQPAGSLLVLLLPVRL